MKKVVIKDKRFKGKQSLLFEITEKKDGDYDIIVNNILIKIIDIKIIDDDGKKVIINEHN